MERFEELQKYCDQLNERQDAYYFVSPARLQESIDFVIDWNTNCNGNTEKLTSGFYFCRRGWNKLTEIGIYKISFEDMSDFKLMGVLMLDKVK